MSLVGAGGQERGEAGEEGDEMDLDKIMEAHGVVYVKKGQRITVRIRSDKIR